MILITALQRRLRIKAVAKFCEWPTSRSVSDSSRYISGRGLSMLQAKEACTSQGRPTEGYWWAHEPSLRLTISRRCRSHGSGRMGLEGGCFSQRASNSSHAHARGHRACTRLRHLPYSECAFSPNPGCPYGANRSVGGLVIVARSGRRGGERARIRNSSLRRRTRALPTRAAAGLAPGDATCPMRCVAYNNHRKMYLS